ncbi:MAG TPA: Crp/Fnr family transcriptional regulator [Sphingomicrobium sp.]|nr:Crp/Fnr family transcriptional regulator [Sphingomicrobium sp.]
MTADRERLDAGFAGNRLLSTFPQDARALLEPFAERVELGAGDVVLRRGADVDSSLFPFGATMISMLVEIGSGRSVEVASIGREGAVGGIVSCGDAPAFTHSVVLVAGPALRIPMSALESAKKASPFIANIFCRFSDYLLAEVMQSVACSAFHSIEQRAAGWLLTAQDRAGDRIALTQEALAGLLGVQRTSVNAAIGALEEEGLIIGRRGAVEVLDRAGLIARACECYGIVERHFAGIIGPSGSGGSAGCG